MKSFAVYAGAAVAEIAGCFGFWAWLRLGKTAWWLVPGTGSLVLFAYLLTLVDAPAAGRAYAAYGGVYIGVAIFWLWLVDAVRPTTTDLVGVAISLVGVAVIMLGAQQD